MNCEPIFLDYMARSRFCGRLVSAEGSIFDWKLAVVPTEWGAAAVHRDGNWFCGDAQMKTVVDYWTRETDKMIERMLCVVDLESRFLLSWSQKPFRPPRIEREFLLHPRGYDFCAARLDRGHSPSNIDLADPSCWRKL